MAQGMGSALEKLVTVDIVDAALKLEQFDPRICRIVGDAAADPTVRAVLEAFDYQPIDLLFVDSAHDYPSTLAHFSIFDALLAPRVVVFDDIVLCESMARLWADLTALYGDAAADATWIEPAVRSGECGFGIILRRP
jgi:predicted O-methyltransferase YrrM